MSGVIQLGADELSVGERERERRYPDHENGGHVESGQRRVIDSMPRPRPRGRTSRPAPEFCSGRPIPAGETGVIVPVSILDDDLSEQTETFTISLVNVDSGTLLSPRTARISILDDENPVLPPSDSAAGLRLRRLLQPVIQGLVEPIDLEVSATDPSMVYVATKAGQIYAYDFETGARLSTVLDISAKVNNDQDRGLLDIALHPDFENNPYIYAFYVVDPPESAGSVRERGSGRCRQQVRLPVEIHRRRGTPATRASFPAARSCSSAGRRPRSPR